MYYLSTTGYGYSKRLCKSITSWFLKKQLPRHKIFLDVHHRGLKREDAMGFCDYCDWSSRPRDFTIELQTHLPKEEYIRTFLHELVHLRQWVRGTLQYKSGRMLFNNERISKYEYMEQPHEIEAYASEEPLYLEYMLDTTGNWYGDE